MSLKPISVWGHWGAPNPWKVCTVLEALNIPYEMRILELNETKSEAHVAVNPNGRLPTIEDPNTGVTLWESAAIILYLVDTYDKENKLSYTTSPEKYQLQQWLAFQISGQGPYFGQGTWFARFHPEKIPSAIDRYINEVFRVYGVLEEGLKRNGTGWLVGNKCTYADLSFVTWSKIGEGLLKELGKFDGFEEKYPLYTAWMARLAERPEVAKTNETVAKNRAARGFK